MPLRTAVDRPANTRSSGTWLKSRTNKAIEAILRIGNLSNRQIYDFEDAEVRKVVRALKDAVTSVEARFKSPRGKTGGGFKL